MEDLPGRWNLEGKDPAALIGSLCLKGELQQILGMVSPGCRKDKSGSSWFMVHGSWLIGT